MEEYDTLSDEELIVRLRGGDAAVEDYLMEKYKGLVRQKARAMFLIGGDTDDLIQEGMIGLFKAVRDYQDDRSASFQTFARMCVDRQIYSAIQNSNRQKHMPLNSYISLSQEDEEDRFEEAWMESPENIVIDQESTRALQAEIARNLSTMENKVLECYLSGESYSEIGSRLGKSAKAIDNALGRIRRKIRDCLDKYKK